MPLLLTSFTGFVELWGSSEALYLPAALSLIADFHQDKTRSLAVGIHMTGLYVGQAIGGFGATFAAMYSWHGTFHWFGIIGIGYGVILAFFLRDKERGTVSAIQEKVKKIPVLKSLGMLFSNVFFWIILFYFCVPGTPDGRQKTGCRLSFLRACLLIFPWQDRCLPSPSLYLHCSEF